MTRKTPLRIVIAGGGFGGAYAARALERSLKDHDVELTLIDRHNFFVFHPLLVEAGTGHLEPRHTVVGIRAFLKTTCLRMGEVVSVDPDHQTLSVRNSDGAETSIPYDHLILALGSVTRLPRVPGLREHGFQLKTLDDAIGLRDRAIDLLERANETTDPDERRALLHFVVVGGNFTGVEVAGEFLTFMNEASHAYGNVSADDCRVTLIELTDRVLGVLDSELSDFALEALRGCGMEVLLQSAVTEIREREVELQSGETMPTRTVIWCAGIAPNPILAASSLPTDELGYLKCDADLRVAGFANVWGIGDCALNPDPAGKPYPATAQYAVQQAKHVAGNLRRVLAGQPTANHIYKSKGSLAALGCRTGVAQVMGIKLSGFPAWWLWRTAYLMMMPGWSRRARVAIDWTLSLLFPREHVKLGYRKRERSGLG